MSAASAWLQPLREALAEFGAKPCHQDRLLRLWLAGLPLNTPPVRREHHLPASVNRSLGQIQALFSAFTSLAEDHPSQDSARRLLLRLADGQTVETVLLPRAGLCVSSQVGCAVGCQFCMTGRSGLIRQLSASEMVSQLALGRTLREVRKVVFMGMGEPAHNLEQVIEAIQVMGTLGALAHKNLVFSTVGDSRVFERLPGLLVKPALALSLHSTDEALRAQLLPRAPSIGPERLVSLAQAYASQTGYPIQYQWTLLAGVNDTPAEEKALIRLLSGAYAVLNLIPFNAVVGTHFRRPEAEAALAMARRLQAAGVVTRLRQSAGQEIDAGCGQLRARSLTSGLVQTPNRPTLRIHAQ